MKYRDRTIATIDLGTNSVLLLVVQRNDQGEVRVLHEGSEVVRLGEKLKQTGNISPAALDRTISAIKNYQTQIAPFNVEKIYLTATSAMREAQNQQEIVDAITAATSLEVEILPKAEETRLAYKSVTAEEPHEDPALVIDIGGGSTEIAWGMGSRYDGGRSLDLGTVKLIEGIMSKEILSSAELDLARAEIDNALVRVTALGDLDYYYGTAGSFTQAAALDLKLTEYSSKAVDHHKLKKENVSAWIQKLSQMTNEEKKSLPGADPKRTDVMLAGMLIIERLYQKFETSEFIVRDRGVRFGKAFDQFRDFKPDIIFA
jgi:exopolyphosphatase/guanosine-5'-triphosphate,3'-diphosphate pyrophosphatase